DGRNSAPWGEPERKLLFSKRWPENRLLNEIGVNMATMAKRGKQGKQGRSKLDMNRFLVQVLILMEEYRPSEITFARVARHCRVPRSTLYYYFGASRVAMVDEAIRYGMSRFVKLSGSSDFTKFPSFDAFERKRMRRSLR